MRRLLGSKTFENRKGRVFPHKGEPFDQRQHAKGTPSGGLATEVAMHIIVRTHRSSSIGDGLMSVGGKVQEVEKRVQCPSRMQHPCRIVWYSGVATRLSLTQRNCVIPVPIGADWTFIFSLHRRRALKSLAIAEHVSLRHRIRCLVH